MVADHAQHVRGVLLVAGEGAKLLRHFGGGGVAGAGHHGGQRAAECTAFLRVVGEAHGHQQAADVGVAEAQRAEFVGEFCNRLGRELRHHHRDFEHHGPQAAEVFIGFGVEAAGLRIVERQQVGGGEVARRVVEEHVFRARIGRADVAAGFTSVPVVHGGVVVQAGIGRGPGGVADLFPQVAGLERLGHLLVGAADQIPVAVGFHRTQEVVLERDGVVRVLACNGEIRFRIPVGVVDVEGDVLVALFGELDHPLDHVVGDEGAARELDLAAQGRVLLGIEAVVV